MADSYVAPIRFNMLGQMQNSTPNFDSPLDFSTKNMNHSHRNHSQDEEEEEDDVDVEVEMASPKSKLRNILSAMKNGSDALNLTKDSPPSRSRRSSMSHSGSGHSSWSRASSPLSPSMEHSLEVENGAHLVPEPQKFPGAVGLQQQMQAQMQQMFGTGLTFSPWGSFSPTTLSPGVNGGVEQLSPQNGGGGAVSGAAGPMFSHLLPVPIPHTSPMQQLPVANGGGGKVKSTRPFKAYPKDPMSFPVGMYGLPVGNEAIQQSQLAYAEFRKQMLSSTTMSRGRRASSKGGSGSDEGLSFSRISPSDQPDPDHSNNANGRKSEQQMKDDAYWERRRKNNEAAKRSRDARRAKEDEIAIRAAFLEQENLKLRFELCALKNEAAKLRCMLYST